jgi:hypothetical protein
MRVTTLATTTALTRWFLTCCSFSEAFLAALAVRSEFCRADSRNVRAASDK